MPKIQRIPVVVEYTKGKGKKKYNKVFTDLKCVDEVLVQGSKHLPKNAVIQEVQVGTSFVKRLKQSKNK